MTDPWKTDGSSETVTHVSIHDGRGNHWLATTDENGELGKFKGGRGELVYRIGADGRTVIEIHKPTWRDSLRDLWRAFWTPSTWRS